MSFKRLFLVLISILFVTSCSNVNKDSSVDSESNTTIPIESNTTIPSKPESEVGYNVRFIANDVVIKEGKFIYYNEITLPEDPKRPAYEFKGWYLDKDTWLEKLDNTITLKLTSDLDIYAYFEYIDTRDIAPSFSVDLLFGKGKFNLSENMDKITVVNFWYSSCPPCLMEMPYLDDIAFYYRKDINVVAIHENLTYSKEVDEFIKKNYRENNIKFALDDSSNSITKAFGGGDFYPLTIFINKEGRIAYTKSGAFTENELYGVLDMVLDEYR